MTRPDRIHQLVAPRLRDGFPPLRADSMERKRLRREPPRPRRKQQSFAETAGQVRRMLPVMAPGLREPMAELGAALFTADRALRGADGFLVRVDAKRLARRLGDRRKE